MGPALELDQRIPLPTPATPTACHSNPQAFDVDRGEVTDPAAADRIRQAKATCRTCPIAAACLRWALTHPDLTRIGVWAATTAFESHFDRNSVFLGHGPHASVPAPRRAGRREGRSAAEQ
ncbi:WhiB family transcriptional regulator [Streptomyces mirabilis]